MSESEEVLWVREKVFPYPPENKSWRLIQLLQAIQNHLGYLSKSVLEEVARFLGISSSRVWGVATFYNQFRFHPPGKRQIKVCLGTACHIKGGEVLVEAWRRELGIMEGETTSDREYSLDRVACVGCCAMAPVMLVNEQIIGRATPISIKGVILTGQVGKNDKK